jgi:hypothetical protein
MTVQELMNLLKLEDPEAQVHFAYPSGDHWRTVIAVQVTDVDEGFVKHSAYHNKPVLVDPDESKDDPDVTCVVVLT